MLNDYEALTTHWKSKLGRTWYENISGQLL